MIWQWGGVEETDNPGEKEGIIRTAIGNDEVKDRTVDKKNEDDNALTNNGLANKGDRYKNKNDKVKEDGNELIAKKTNNSVNELKQTKESEANKENGSDAQAVKENENINNNDDDNNNNNNIADDGNNEADEFGMNKHTHDKKRRNKGILNKLFWGKQKSGDEEEEKSSNKHKDKYCENNQEYNNSCDTCCHERSCSSSDDMLILRTTTNKVTTTMTTTTDFHNKDQEEKLIEQHEQPEKREEWEQQIESKTSMEEQAKINSGTDEITTASSGNATKSGKSTHEHLSKKKRNNRAKAEFALHDPLNEEINEENTIPYERDNTAKKTKSKEEHAHHVSCTSDEFEDHMVGSVYKGSDICPHCNYPRSSSVWCSVSFQHHGNDAICAPHHSCASSGHDSGKWSAKTLFKKGKDNKKNEANCEGKDTSHLTDEKTSHPITSWLHRRHRRHDGDGNDHTDDGDKSQENYSCQSEIENRNTDDKNAECTETPVQETLECNTNDDDDDRDHHSVNAHNVAAVCPVNSQVCSSDQTRTHVDYINNDNVNDIVVDKDVDNVENKQTEDSARLPEEKSHKKVQYYYFVNDNGETMYYATEVEDENANNSDGGGHDNVVNVTTTVIMNSQNENVSDINKNINCNQDNEHQLATNVCEKINIDETTNVGEGSNVHHNISDNNKNFNNSEIAEDINDNTSSETASQTSLTTTNSTSQSSKEGKKKRGFAKKIAHFFSRSNKSASEKEKENVSHHVDPNATEINVESNVNETVCHNKTSSCYSADKEQPTIISENNVRSAEKYDPYADDDHNNENYIENYNYSKNVEVQIIDTNEGEYTYDTKNNVYVSEKPAATTVVVTEVAYDTKVHEKKVPRLTEKEFKQRIKELCKDEKKQRMVLEMEYKKESSEIKRCCRAGVEEIKRVCHNKKHNIKEHKDKSDDADDEKGKKELHKENEERLELEESK